MTRTVAVVTAGLSQPSSTRLLADRLANAVTERLSEQGEDTLIEVVELRTLAHALADNLLTGFPSGELEAAVRTVAEACGVEHPGLIDSGSVEILDGRTGSTPLHEVYGYAPEWGLPSAADRAAIVAIMAGESPQGGSAPPSPDAVG